MQLLGYVEVLAVTVVLIFGSQCAHASPITARSNLTPAAAPAALSNVKAEALQPYSITRLRSLKIIISSSNSNSSKNPAAASTNMPAFRRRLQQFAGLTNLLVGAGIQGSQRAINAASAASQLKNFYGVEGLGMRHRLGALPAPGGLELLLLKGPKALPGPKGFTAGFIGGTAEALAATANPVNAVLLGKVFQDMAASNGMGHLVGAQGLSGLGLQTGTAAMLADKVAGGAGGAHPAAVLAAGGSGSGGLSTPALMNLGVQGHLVGQQTGMSLHPLQGNLVGTAAINTAATDRSAAAAALIAQAGQTAGTLVSNAGQIKGAAIQGASQMASQTVAASGHGGSAGMSQVSRAVRGSTVSGVGGMFLGAGRFLNRITQLTGPGAAAPASVSGGTTVHVASSPGSSSSSIPESGGSDLVSVTPGWNGPQGFDSSVSSSPGPSH